MRSLSTERLRRPPIRAILLQLLIFYVFLLVCQVFLTSLVHFYVKKRVLEKIGDVFYKLQDEQQKWLLICEYLLALHKSLPDFYPTVSSSLKVIEESLKIYLLKYRIFVNNREGGFRAIFDKDGKLRINHRTNMDSRHIDAFENGYYFMTDRRNRLQHAQIKSETITKKDAENVLTEVYNILMNFYEADLL